MACIGFDLDETLGRFSTPHYNTLFLQPHIVLYEEGQFSGRYGTQQYPAPIPLSPTLRKQLDTAFNMFANCLAEKERTANLGLLRPGIVEIAKQLYESKQRGQVRSVLIYSNNGNLALLHLAGKMIEKLADAPGLFCNYLHWFHPSRATEVEYGRPGAARKTIAVLQKAFQEGSCTSELVEPENIFFIDDIQHENIFSAIGPNHYIQVLPYKFDADPHLIDECFRNVKIESGLESNSEYWAYIQSLGTRTLDDIMRFLKQNQIRFLSKSVPNNTTFRSKMNQTFPKPLISQNTFRKALTTLRKLESKLNLGKNLNARETIQLTTSRNIVTKYESQNQNQSGGRQNKTKRKSRNRSWE